MGAKRSCGQERAFVGTPSVGNLSFSDLQTGDHDTANSEQNAPSTQTRTLKHSVLDKIPRHAQSTIAESAANMCNKIGGLRGACVPKLKETDDHAVP